MYEKNWCTLFGRSYNLTFTNTWGHRFDFESIYKPKVITDYHKKGLQRVSYICDTYMGAMSFDYAVVTLVAMNMLIH